jgi:6-phosphogluconolactonase (cycloisomerase 2 family)
MATPDVTAPAEPSLEPRVEPPVALWVGTYPAAGAGTRPGTGEGVWRVELDPATGALTGAEVSRTPAPSFLATAADGAVLLAACETAPGAVVLFHVTDDGGLVERERVTSGGSEPCHLLVHPSGSAVYVANYGSGSLGVLLLEPAADGGGLRFAGGLSQVFEHSGRGPYDERQEGPHLHSTILLPDAREPGGAVLVAMDLGTDELRRYRVQPDGRLVADGLAARMDPGTGPRHAALTAEGHLVVVGELTATVHLMRWDAATATATELDAVPVGEPGDALPAHVTVDGDRVLVGVRGPDVLVSLDVVGDRLRVAGETATAAWPRHHGTVAGWTVVAGQGEDRLVVHVAGPAVEPVVSEPVAGGTGLDLPVPACVVPSPGR